MYTRASVGYQRPRRGGGGTRENACRSRWTIERRDGAVGGGQQTRIWRGSAGIHEHHRTCIAPKTCEKKYEGATKTPQALQQKHPRRCNKKTIIIRKRWRCTHSAHSAHLRLSSLPPTSACCPPCPCRTPPWPSLALRLTRHIQSFANTQTTITKKRRRTERESVAM